MPVSVAGTLAGSGGRNANLVEMLRDALTPKLAGDASTYLGESPATTRTAVTAVIPAVVAGLAQQSTTAAGAATVFNTITSPQIDSGLADDIGSSLRGGGKTSDLLSQGGSLVRGLFGQRTGAVADAVSSISGMTTSSVSTLLTLSVPMIFAWLKRYLMRDGIDASGLAGLLAGQGEHLGSRLDERITGALGFATPTALLASLASGATGSARAAAGRIVDTAREVGSGATRSAEAAYAVAGGALAGARPPSLARRGWLWGVLAAAALALILLIGHWRAPVDQAAKATQNAAGTITRSVKSLELPDGGRLEVTSGGSADSLASFLASKNAAAGRSFTLDEIQFETGSARLTPASDRQLDGLAAVLKAYGGVTVNVAGYTDNTGDAVANKRLSADRADAVKQALVSKGIAATRISDEGFGPEKPVASNDTEEGRVKNRRVELALLKR